MNDLVARCTERRDLLPILKEGQSRYGFLPAELLSRLAEALEVPVNDVYGVASFYSFLTLALPGRNTIWMCRCLPCHLKDGRGLLDAVQEQLGVGPGETTVDGCFTLRLTNCIGACDQAPALMVNNDRYGSVIPGRLAEILSRYR
ncbi:MAG: NAD(P)H-dependent oxidoreductase subunit E [Chloroflexota bacterium]|nr:MAG: NAD(P)H-dependent oxidoreductase subunit E [Chloroflexota bacterium]